MGQTLLWLTLGHLVLRAAPRSGYPVSGKPENLRPWERLTKGWEQGHAPALDSLRHPPSQREWPGAPVYPFVETDGIWGAKCLVQQDGHWANVPFTQALARSAELDPLQALT